MLKKHVMMILMMVQKSGVHQLRLVVYPIYLQGFSTIPKVFFFSRISEPPWEYLRGSCFHEIHNTEVGGFSILSLTSQGSKATNTPTGAAPAHPTTTHLACLAFLTAEAPGGFDERFLWGKSDSIYQTWWWKWKVKIFKSWFITMVKPPSVGLLRFQ